MSKEKHNPTPWKIAEGMRETIVDAQNTVIANAANGKTAEFIIDAVNLYTLFDAARTDSEGNKHILTVKGEDGKPTCIITPPASETELVRAYKTENHNLFKDRILFERQRNELWNERERLRGLVRRLAEQLQDAVCLTPYDAIARALIREAREAIGEDN